MTNSSSNNSPAMSMAELLKSHKVSFKTFRKGDIVEGKIAKLTKSEILVDVQAKSLAVVLEKEKALLNTLISTLHVGDIVDVSILNPESEMGNPVVSLRRFMSNISWKKLEDAMKDETQISVRVTDITKGGLVVISESGVSGFLPNSHMNTSTDLSVGKDIKVRVIEVNRLDNKLIFSQKLTISKDLFDQAIKKLKIGESISITIMNVVPFGVFVSIVVPGMKNTLGEPLLLDGLIHISEISWEKVEDVSTLFVSGQEITAKIIGFDKNTRRVDLSIKQMTSDPFEELLSKYPVDKKVTGSVLKIDDSGILISFEDGVEGLIKKDKIPPTVTYTEGQSVNLTVSGIDKRRRKIHLLPILLEKPLMYR